MVYISCFSFEDWSLWIEEIKPSKMIWFGGYNFSINSINSR